MDECSGYHDSRSKLLDKGESQAVHAGIEESRPQYGPKYGESTGRKDNEQRSNAERDIVISIFALA